MSVIKAGTTVTTALVLEGNTDGDLIFKTGSAAVTAMSISASGVVTFPATTGFDIASANITNLTSGTTSATVLRSGSATLTNLLATTLTVSGLGAFPLGASATPSIIFSGDPNTGIYSPAADNFAVSTGGAERLRIDASGNAGLGVTPSAWSSIVKAYQVGNTSLVGTSTQMLLSQNYFFDGSDRYIAAGPASQYYLVDGAHYWRSASSGSAGAVLSLTQVLAVDKSKSLALEGASPQSGTGITFPATQSASSNANTLDDYEEGTWSPRIENAAGSTVLTLTNMGIYTKVGGMVHVQINAYNQTVTAFTTTEQLYLAGLPFTSQTNIYVLTFNTYVDQPVWALDGGANTKFSLWVPSGAVDSTHFTRNTWGGSGTMTFRGNFVYEAS